MAFVPSYGEPDWPCRPTAGLGSVDVTLGPLTNASYEENRLRNMSRDKDSEITFRLWKANDKSSDESRPLVSSLSVVQLTYLRWSQSPLVEILVGPKEDVFRLPGDFLARRSDPFRVMLGHQFQEAKTRVIRLPETNFDAFQQIAIWLMSPRPFLSPNLPLEIVVDVAIFSTVYLLPALLHQSLDILRVKMMHWETLWTPTLLDRVYQYTDERSLLRELVRIALPAIDRPIGFPISDKALEEWQEVFEDHPELGFDYFVACRKGVNVAELSKGGPCRFHRHATQNFSPASTTSNKKVCQLLGDECFEEIHPANLEYITQIRPKPEHDSAKQNVRVSFPASSISNTENIGASNEGGQNSDVDDS